MLARPDLNWPSPDGETALRGGLDPTVKSIGEVD